MGFMLSRKHFSGSPVNGESRYGPVRDGKQRGGAKLRQAAFAHDEQRHRIDSSPCSVLLRCRPGGCRLVKLSPRLFRFGLSVVKTAATGSQRRFLQDLAKRGMSVTTAGEIIGRPSSVHGQRDFVDEFAGVGAQDMSAQDQ
ncbi:MAG: hypothetical protein M2R45_05405 [Verrucomicrobia subdivision 3 bacterium]|nr:hypothetical protein [Limisphaerales bacterium]MCS1416744.1 hypothetical protein [Limisphaerales bacterium]